MEIQSDFKELLELLNAHKVAYIIVGGYALAFHGSPRFTGDIDVFVKADDDNAQKVLDVLKEFGLGSIDLVIDDFNQPNKVIQLGVPPVRIDIMTSLTGVSWDQAESSKVQGDYAGVKVYYLGKNDLIANKQKLGRKKDQADLEALGES
ncbi:MAG: nucleotidyltransferase [Sedimentisphaerales bacterium]|nr:nucleotidyltransferase [Sedimentisphaerales bacterium]